MRLQRHRELADIRRTGGLEMRVVDGKVEPCDIRRTGGLKIRLSPAVEVQDDIRRIGSLKTAGNLKSIQISEFWA